MSLPIYLDHHATTPVDPRVLDAMSPYWSTDFGNPASRAHVYGWRAEAAVDAARASIAREIGASDPSEIVFTSGATEANNLALLGIVRRRARHRTAQVITVATEHAAVLDPCRALVEEGCTVSLLSVDADGLIDLDELAAAFTPETVLVSVMAANNEIGVLQPLPEIGALCRERGVLFHTDAAQAVGKIPLDVRDAQIDLLSLSGHKVYGPKGVGALYVRSGRPRIQVDPLMYGGGHERGLRSGTVPTPLVVGLAHALELCAEERDREMDRLAKLRDALWSRLRERTRNVWLNGHPTKRLPGNLHVSFAGIEADQLVADLHDVALSTGSACSSSEPRPSHVLEALGVGSERERSGIRIGLGRGTSEEEVERAAVSIAEAVRKQRT